METISLKALAIQRLQGNRRGNNKETPYSHEGNFRETYSNGAKTANDDEVEKPKGRPLESGWRKSLANLPADFRQLWSEIVELRCQGGELRPIAEALAYCDIEEAFAAWQKYH